MFGLVPIDFIMGPIGARLFTVYIPFLPPKQHCHSTESKFQSYKLGLICETPKRYPKLLISVRNLHLLSEQICHQLG